MEMSVKRAKEVAFQALKDFESQLSLDPALCHQAEKRFEKYLDAKMVPIKVAQRQEYLRSLGLKPSEVCQICLRNGRISKLRTLRKAYVLRQLRIAAKGLPDRVYAQALNGFPDSWTDCPAAWRFNDVYWTLHKSTTIFESLLRKAALAKLDSQNSEAATSARG